MSNFLSRLQDIAKPGIGRRLAMYILMFSSVVTLVSTVLQLTLDYRRDVGGIRKQLEQIRVSYLQSLASSLWVSSKKDVRLQLEGILRLPDMQYLEVVSDQHDLEVAVGEKKNRQIISYEFGLYYTHRGNPVHLGKLHAVASLDGVYQRLEDKVLVILVSQAVKTFLVSFFILFLFQVLIGRHLKRIASYSEHVHLDQMVQPLALDRHDQAPGTTDELDLVVNAINDMRLNLKQYYKDLQASEETLRLAIETTQDGIWDWDLRSNTIQYSPGWARLLGYTHDEATTDYAFWDSKIHPDDRDETLAAVHDHLQGRSSSFAVEHRLRTKYGDWKWVLGRGRVVEWAADGTPVRVVGDTSDISYRRQSEEQLRLAATVFDNIREAIMVTDASRRIVRVNKAFADTTGFSAADAVGQDHRILYSQHQDDDAYARIWGAVNDTGHWKGEIANLRKNGDSYPAWLGITAVYDTYGNITHYVGILSDISEIKINEARIEHLAHHDPLTGLPNRILLNDRLERALAAARRQRSMVALLFLDLDHFKVTNDSLGHVIGDKLLQSVSARLQECVRGTDTVSRQGGDEFLIVIGELQDVDTAGRVARKILERLSEPFNVEGHNINTSFSIGVSMYPGDGQDFASLLRKADTALYHAKQGGRNNYHFFTESMNASVFDRMQLENRLRQALSNNELSLVFQPLVDLRTGQTVGAEALLRWHNSELGNVSPARFIPIAEEAGLITTIGKWVLHEACRQLRLWQQAGLPSIVMAVNISAVQFKRDNLVETVAEVLRESGVPPDCLELELTESALMQESERVLDVLQRLKALGVSLSIDDFGTGYSSLSYLKRFSVDKLKIDQSFVRDLAADSDDAAIVLAVIQLGHSLKLRTIAEGVETQDQLNFLRENGCHEAQGYFLSRPIPAEEFALLLAQGTLLAPAKTG